MLCKERKDAALRAKSQKPLDWRGHGPKWLGKDIWNKLCEDHWDKGKFQKQSEAGRNNKMTLKDDSISTHTGGLKPFAAHHEDMQDEYNREVSKIELYDRTHRKNQGTGEFSCNKSKRVRATYDNLAARNESSSNPSSPHTFDDIAWIEASGGVSKGRVYGFGSQPPPLIIGDIAHGGSKSKQKEVSGFIRQETKEQFDLLQKEVEKLKDTNSAIIKAMEQHLPETISKMLQDIQWTNHNHAGGSRQREQEFLDSGRQCRSHTDSNRNNSENARSNGCMDDANEGEANQNEE